MEALPNKIFESWIRYLVQYFYNLTRISQRVRLPRKKLIRFFQIVRTEAQEKVG